MTVDPAAGQEKGRALTREEAVAVQGIGRVTIAGNRSCTGTLIAAELVLTAGHCLFSPLTGRRSDPSQFRFVAGLWQGEHVALREVTRTAVLPDYQPGGAVPDLALLELSQPILPGDVSPVVVSDWAGQGAVEIVAYGQDRLWRPSVREDCRAVWWVPPWVDLNCLVVPGISGAPVLQRHDGGLSLVAIVSAKYGPPVDAGPALAVRPWPYIDSLRAQLRGG